MCIRDSVQITNDEIFEKMKKGNITAYIQPVFIEEDMKIAEIRLGEKRISTSTTYSLINIPKPSETLQKFKEKFNLIK